MSIKRVAVIGAGIAGIAAVKESLAVDLEVKCFEKSPWVGGIWHAYNDIEGNNATTPMYKSCVGNGSSPIFSFSDFPVPKNWPLFLRVKHVDEYLNMYVDNFSLRKHIYTSHTVTKVSQDSKTNIWHVRYQVPDTKTESEELFDWVIICTGCNTKPRMPYFVGQDTFEGELLHFQKYWEPTKYANKRVVIIGPGGSGCDAAIEISNHATETYLVDHSGRDYVVRLSKNFKPVDSAISRMLFQGFPKSLRLYLTEKFVRNCPPWLLPSDMPFGEKLLTITSSMLFECLATGAVEVVPGIASFSGRDVHLTDGRVLSNIDVVIYATGYDIALDVLEDPSIFYRWPEGLENVEKGDGSIVNVKESSLARKMWLWKGILPPETEGIAFIGYTLTPFGAPPLYEMQARYIAALITSQTLHPLPPVPQMHADIQAHYLTLNRYIDPFLLSDNPVSYLDWYAEEAAGALPSFWKVLREYGYGTAMKVFTGSLIPQHWRLVGKGKWEGAEKVILNI